MKQKIIPSTMLKTVSVHKLQDLTCKRYYFWKWIMNLVSRKLPFSLWFGSMIHAGAGAHAAFPKALKKMQKASKEFLSRYSLNSEDKLEIQLQNRIAKTLLKIYLPSAEKRFKKVKILGTEVPFKHQLKSCAVLLEGTADDFGEEGKDCVLIERKTASRVGDSYFKRLKFDKQINSYCNGVEILTNRKPKRCYYDVIRKPQLQMHKKDTIDTFVKRLKADFKKRHKFYFFTYTHLFGGPSVRDVMQDIEATTYNLLNLYKGMSTQELLQPKNWPRNDRQCFEYGTCPYYPLCAKSDQWWLYLNLYMPRQLRYAMEGDELSDTDAIAPGFHAKLKFGKGPPQHLRPAPKTKKWCRPKTHKKGKK